MLWRSASKRSSTAPIWNGSRRACPQTRFPDTFARVSTPLELGTDQVLAHVDEHVGWITLNNPERHNAISSPMFDAIEQAALAFRDDADVRVVVIRGAGEEAFAAGADLNDLPQEGFLAGMSTFTEMDKPTIAMIGGWCLGGGVMTAACADIRVAADHSIFSIPAGRLGVGYPLPGVMRLVEIVGSSATAELLLTAERFDAEWALRHGLAQRVVPKEELLETVTKLAANIAQLAPLSAAASKRSIRAAVGTGTDAAAMEAISAAWRSEDVKEGQAAFSERRRANFTGH